MIGILIMIFYVKLLVNLLFHLYNVYCEIFSMLHVFAQCEWSLKLFTGSYRFPLLFMLESSGIVMQTHLNRLHFIQSQITPACLLSTNSASSEIKFFEYKDIPWPVPI